VRTSTWKLRTCAPDQPSMLSRAPTMALIILFSGVRCTSEAGDESEPWALMEGSQLASYLAVLGNCLTEAVIFL